MRSRVDGEWSGWAGDTTVKLENGTVWQQDQYYYRYKYKYRPRVAVDGNKMIVEGIDKAVRVRRID
jgi:hypothetical protein